MTTDFSRSDIPPGKKAVMSQNTLVTFSDQTQAQSQVIIMPSVPNLVTPTCIMLNSHDHWPVPALGRSQPPAPFLLSIIIPHVSFFPQPHNCCFKYISLHILLHSDTNPAFLYYVIFLYVIIITLTYSILLTSPPHSHQYCYVLFLV